MKKFVMALPSFIVSGVAALPVLTCPACWPLYAGLLGALGLGFIDYTPFLFPLTALLLLVAFAPLVWRAPRRWGYKPLAIGVIGAVLILSGKFWIENTPLYYAGIAILLLGSIWNIWPKSKDHDSCVSQTHTLLP